MKKRWLVYSLLLLLSVGLFGCAGSGETAATQPVPVVPAQLVWGEGHHRTPSFTCTPGNGDALEISYTNAAQVPCWVDVYEEGVFQTTRVSRMEVAPGNPARERLSVPNPGGNRYYLHFTAADGGLIQGDLTAVQRNP